MKVKSLCVVLFVLLVFCCPVSAVTYSDLVVFGDSLSDSGNSYLLMGVPISPPYYDGRFSNGPNYADDLAQKLGINLIASLMGGNNFAVGDARTKDMLVQVQSFKGKTSRADFDRNQHALFVVFIGGNDIRDAIAAQNSRPLQKAIRNIEIALRMLKQEGAENILVFNVPDLGITPEVISMESSIPGISKYATHLSKEFNEMLDSLLPQYNGLNILRVNTFALLNNVYGSPQRYGLTDVMDPCFSGDEQTAGVVCNNPDAYLFWDSIHPTAAVHEILAEKVYVAIENCHKKGQLSLCAQDLDR